MKALVYLGPGKKSWEEKPKPSISHSTDKEKALKVILTNE